MILLWFVFVMLFSVTLFDIWKMAKSEFVYWDLINALLAREDVNKEAVRAKKDLASTQVSYAQFGVWYLTIAMLLTGMVFEGWIQWYAGIGTFLSLTLLHYSGAEDLGYFILANWITIDESWWITRETVQFAGLRFPKYLPWLAVPRKIFGITIKPYWITFFAGPEVGIGGLAIGVLVVMMIVITISVLT